MKTGNKASGKHLGGAASAPVSRGLRPGEGFGPLGGEGFGPLGGEGFGPLGGGGGGLHIGGGYRSKAIFERIAKHFGHLAKAFDDLANTPIGAVPNEKGPAKKK
jgi:hypothetical protein